MKNNKFIRELSDSDLIEVCEELQNKVINNDAKVRKLCTKIFGRDTTQELLALHCLLLPELTKRFKQTFVKDNKETFFTKKQLNIIENTLSKSNNISMEMLECGKKIRIIPLFGIGLNELIIHYDGKVEYENGEMSDWFVNDKNEFVITTREFT